MLRNETTSQAVHAVLLQYQPYMPSFQQVSLEDVSSLLPSIASKLKLVDRIQTRLVLVSNGTDITRTEGLPQVRVNLYGMV